MSERPPIRVSVGGGKGGIGKSVVSVNLATTLASIGMRTVLVDADLGTPTLHTLLGIDRRGPTLQALIDRKIGRLEEAMIGTRIPHLSVIPGTAQPGAANLGHQEKLKLLRHVRSLDAEVVIVDVGAGAAFNTLDLYLAGDLRLVVTTPELTSLQNAYCFLKAAVVREVVALARSLGASEDWARAFDTKDTSRMSAWLDRLGAERPDVARRVRLQVSRFGARWVGNRVAGPASEHSVHALSRLSSEFLGVDAPVIAAVPPSRAVESSIQAREPAILGPGCEPALIRSFETLAEHVLAFEPPPRALPTDVDLPAMDPSETPDEFARRLGPHLRRDERIAVRLPAEVLVGGERHEGVVLDVSRLGLRVQCAAPVQSGERVVVLVRSSYGNVEVSGSVRHAAKAAFGLLADEECAPRLLALVPKRTLAARAASA